MAVASRRIKSGRWGLKSEDATSRLPVLAVKKQRNLNSEDAKTPRLKTPRGARLNQVRVPYLRARSPWPPASRLRVLAVKIVNRIEQRRRQGAKVKNARRSKNRTKIRVFH